ncbi:MAG TPA: 4-(cytidine 5'-diphospho)-2-C-methyl-D-erythritol kinase [Ktedonobacteraceae bacterium]|nr:4-(cytidine 5'-diphospho)-2-C-methyl-D-erythritol kinase [Ktedonobacteraceae bacterium]
MLDKDILSRHNAHMSHEQQVHNWTGETYFIQSYAKINLTLDILGRRADGYHDLATVMQMIDLSDTICLTAIDEDCVRVVCSRPDLSNADNLVVRAAQAVRQRLGLSQGVLIELQKRIPVAAGLAGGSSNATAVLLALQRWWHLPLSSTDLFAIAASLGSDVSFFLSGGQALCEGRGERVTPLPAHWPATMRWIVLLKPAIGIATATVFRNLPASDYTDATEGHTHSNNVCTALRTRQEFALEHLHNGLERSVLEHYPEVAAAREALLQAGARWVRLSGSGPTLFTTFPDLESAAQTEHTLRDQGYEVYLTRAIFPNGENVYYYH